MSRALGVEHGIEVSALGPWAHDLIDHGLPWTPFLTTIWVCQRPAVLGAAVLLVAMAQLHRGEFASTAESGGEQKSERSWHMFLAGALLGLGPLAHAHLIISGVLYAGCLFFVSLVLEAPDKRKARLRDYALFAFAGLPGLMFLPWLLGKSGITQISGAWMQGELYQQQGLLAAWKAGLELWWVNARVWLVVVVLYVGLTRRFRLGVVFLLLFAFGNIVQLAVWNWDQLKFFVGLFLITLSWFAASKERVAWRLHWVMLLATIPAIAEVWVSVLKYERFTVYSVEDIQLAEKIRALTPPSAIIAANPLHNSPITLTGRKLYYGYEGTLHSHGLDYLGRRQIQLELDRVEQCKAKEAGAICPDYLLWTSKEQEYWKKPTPGSGALPTSLPELFRLPNSKS